MKQVTITGLTVREAQVALLDAVNEGVLDKYTQWKDGETRIAFNEKSASFTLCEDNSDVIMSPWRSEIQDETTWRVTEGILRLAAAAKRNGGGK